MKPHERMVARWLTEEWDQEATKMPRWLLHRVWHDFSYKKLEKPSALIREICINLLHNHRNEISLRHKEI